MRTLAPPHWTGRHIYYTKPNARYGNGGDDLTVSVIELPPPPPPVWVIIDGPSDNAFVSSLPLDTLAYSKYTA